MAEPENIAYATPSNDVGKKILEQMKTMEDVRSPYENGLWIWIARFVNSRRENIQSENVYNLKGQRHAQRRFRRMAGRYAGLFGVEVAQLVQVGDGQSVP